MEKTVSVMEPAKLQSEKTTAIVIYALYAAFFMGGITSLIAIVASYIKKGSVAGTFLESHYRWQIRTFWHSLFWGILGTVIMGIGALRAMGSILAMLDAPKVPGDVPNVPSFLDIPGSLPLLIGSFISFANIIWFLYCIIKGWLRLKNNKAMYTD